MRFAVLIVLVMVSGLAIACGSTPAVSEKNNAVADVPSISSLTLEVSTIYWDDCQPRVEASVRTVSGVLDVQFDEQDMKRIIISYNPSEATVKDIINAIEAGGDTFGELVPD